MDAPAAPLPRTPSRSRALAPLALVSRMMMPLSRSVIRLGPRFLPFADAASPDLPIGRLLRLSLFQVSVGLAAALLVGTLNRVMIVELGVHAWLVALMVSLPLVVAPFRAFIGHKSDRYRSAIGWRRVPYVFFGTLMQFAGLSIMPFALVLLSGEGSAPTWVGQVAAAAAFVLVGAGMQTTQTAGLALATDLAPEDTRPRVVSLMYVMLLVGMVGSGFVFGLLLRDFTATRLVQVVQGCAVLSVLLNAVAMWKQEARDPDRNRALDNDQDRADFLRSWRQFIAQPRARRFLWAVGLGTAGFNMQDIVLEPYGGEILRLSVGETSTLTALMAGGALMAYAAAARWLMRGHDPVRVAALGAVLGLPAFSAVVFAAPLEAPELFRAGVALIGFGGGLYSVGLLITAMNMERREHVGLALGAWGSVQALAGGASVAAGGAIRDGVSALAGHGALGPVLADPAIGYSVVYHIEITLLFVTLIAVGPLVRPRRQGPSTPSQPQNGFGLADLPG